MDNSDGNVLRTIAHGMSKKNQQETLAREVQSVRKKRGPQNQKELVIEPQTLKKVIGKYLNL